MKRFSHKQQLDGTQTVQMNQVNDTISVFV
jgi:hypothetical protein